MPEHPFIDTTLAEQLLEKAIAEKGADHKGTCQYVSRDLQTNELQPSCIIGVGLSLLGWTNQELLDFQSVSISTLINGGVVRGSRVAADVLQIAQGLQDSCYSWGSALEQAREHVR